MKKYAKRLVSAVLSCTIMLSCFSAVSVLGADPAVTSGSGFESLWGEWQGSGSYNAYYSENGTDFTKIDPALIRTDDNGNYRVEPLGLKGGTTYTVKIVPVNDNVENEAGAFTFTAQAKSYDRSGYAFFNTTNNPGAYLSDGTLPSNADVIYINDQNKDSVSLYGAKGLKNVLSAHSKQSRPLVIRVIGTIDTNGFSSLDGDKMVESKGTAGLTVEGVGTDAGFYGWGMKIAHGSDAEVRNLHFDWNFEDAIEIQDSARVWIHDNSFTVGHQDNPKEADKDHGDGSCDAKRSDYVTISYNHFNGTAKTCLLGSSKNSVEDAGLYSYHHNYFDNAEQRLPRIRWHNVHVYNNYYNHVGYDLETGNQAGYGIGATCKASIFAENNYFENTYRPMLTSDKVVNGLSNNDGGVIKAYGNIYDNCTGMRDVDRFEAPSKDYQLTAADYTCSLGGGTYNNFDTSEKFYKDDYFLETAEACKSTVLENAGAEKNTTGLKLTNAINGSSTGSGGTGEPETPDNPTPENPGINMDCTYYYDFPSSGSVAATFGGENGSGSYFKSSQTINASGKSGSVTVNGKTYEFSGVGAFANNAAISFTTDKKTTLNIVSCSGSTTQRKLVVTNSAGKTIGTILSGTSSSDSAEALVLDAADTYTITNKGGGEAKLYYIGVKTEDDPSKELIGDADLDGILTATDASIVLQYTLTEMNVDDNFVKRCDVDKDSQITATDASIILQASLIEMDLS